MSSYGKLLINFRNVLTILCLTSIFLLINCNEVEDLPPCEVDNIDKLSPAKNLLFVSTLDGKITALNSKDGSQHWQVQAGDSLLSSSIHRLELSHGGQWVRLVPSLSGSLYRFSGDSLEPLPLSAEQLLSASHKYSDDLVIAGGKETSSLGLSTKTGKVVYECSLNGCLNSTGWTEGKAEHIEDDPGEMVLVRRVTQTVRAIEPRSGQERWNFSVGQHELNLTPVTRCILPTASLNLDDDIVYKVVVPEGLVCAVKKTAPHNVLWKHKLSSPVVGAWQYSNFELKPLDLFGIAYTPLEPEFPNVHSSTPHITPSVYIGMHERQLYIQESVRMQALVQSQVTNRPAIDHVQHKHSSTIIIPWKPVPATHNVDWDSKDSDTALALSEKEYTATALSVLYASEYVNGNGYFLFSSEDRLGIEGPVCDKQNTSLANTEKPDSHEDSESEEDPFEWADEETYNVLVGSLWFWWKEVAVIALSTAVFLNFISNRVRKKFLQEERHTTYLVVERQVPVPQPSMSILPYQDPISSPFTSRYLTDFTPMKCLGRGGFGIVFEAKNKIDDCSYAVKRITLPCRKDKRDKVLREVRALAKLEHKHIVRYFNAWLEEPPLGWEDPFERELKSQLELTETYSKAPPSTNDFRGKKLHKFGNDLSLRQQLWEKGDGFMLDNKFMANGVEFSRQRSYSVNDSFSIVFEKGFQNDASSEDSRSRSHGGNLHRASVDEEESDYDDDSFIVFANADEVDGDKESNNNAIKGGDSVISISDSDFDVKSNGRNKSSDTNINMNSGACVVIDESQICQKPKRGHRKNLSLDLQNMSHRTPEPMQQMYLYIQMQLCKPESLRDWLRENTCPEVRKAHVVTIFDQIVHAVEYVHLQGLIHRDLKPSNIFFSFDGRIRIGDFGLVTAMFDPLTAGDQQRSPIFGLYDTAHDKHTQHVGTHLYMSPEQLRGEAHGYKVDIWSLGLVLVELLLPFETEMERVFALKNIRDGIFPKGFSKTHPQEHSLLSLMLSQDPAQRPSTLGVRARAPLLQSTDPRHHFCLPPISRSTSTSSSLSRSTSGSSSGNT